MTVTLIYFCAACGAVFLAGIGCLLVGLFWDGVADRKNRIAEVELAHILRGHLNELDRWCAHCPEIAATCNRLRNVISKQSVADIGEFRERVCPLGRNTKG